MTVPLQDPEVVYNGNGVTTDFAFPFLVFTAADLLVAVDGATKTLGVDYSLTGLGDVGGGTVMFTPAPGVGTSNVAIRRSVALERETDYQYNGDFQSPSVNRDFDRLWMASQDNAAQNSRALRFAFGDGANGVLPAPSARALRYFGFDENGNITFIPNTPGSIGLTSYQLSAVGAMVRTLAGKLAERVSVKDFGAVGNGLADDTAALQAAINYAANLSPGGTASGCVLYFPPGEYAVTASLVMPAGKPITIQGEGDGSKLRRIGGAGHIIECQSSSKIRGLFFKGPDGGTSNGIYCNGANTAIIENCYFQNQVTGIQLTSSYAVEIISNVFDVCYSYGVAATTSAHNTMIERNNFFTCGVLNAGHAVHFEIASDNLGIQDNDFEYCHVNIAMNACNSVQITGNYMEYHKAACFDFGPGCSGVIIESNWIALGDVVGGGAISTIHNITGGRFSHNTVYNQTLDFTANALVGFDVWHNTKSGTGTLGGAPWNGPVLLNGWGQQANYTAAGFIKDSQGWVHLRGGYFGGAAPATLFNLPAGYRPADIAVFGTESASGACRTTVNPNGDVVPTVAAANNPSLDGISFYVG